MSEVFTLGDFATHIAANILNYLPAEYENAKVQTNHVVKNNNIVLTGILIRKDGSNLCPNIYLNDLYDKYLQDNDLEFCLKQVAMLRVKHDSSENMDISDITDFERVKDKILPKLLNTEMNSEYLLDKPHKEMEDLSIVYYIDLESRNLGDGSGRASVPITNNLLEMYGLSVEELHSLALENLSNMKIEFMSMRDMLVQTMFPDGVPDDPAVQMMLPPQEESPSMYVLSNEARINGAVAILNHDTMKGISDQLGGADYAILPSSIHEVIVLPITDKISFEELEGIVQEVNATQVSPGERLSDRVYCYDSAREEVVLADKMNERLKENHAAKTAGSVDAAQESQMNMRRHRGR